MNKLSRLSLLTALALGASPAFAVHPECDHPSMPSYDAVNTALRNIVVKSNPSAASNGGLDFNMWATVVSTDRTVCVVAKSGDSLNAQWLGSRAIAAQKANTAISFSTPDFALSTANLWAATQPGGSLYGLQFSNPVDPSVIYKISDEGVAAFGSTSDPLVGQIVGGINVFGGGLALYDASGTLIGALGVSGDTSCADHNIAWKLRDALGLDFVPAGVNSTPGIEDNIIYDISNTWTVDNMLLNINASPSGFGHPDCGKGERAIAEQFSTTNPTR